MGVEGLLPALNGEASGWATRMGHACLSGGGFILGVWAVCRLAPRLPASGRAWLWWLACLKLTVDLCGFAPLALPLLPTAPAVTAQIAAPAMPLAAPGLPARADKRSASPAWPNDDPQMRPTSAAPRPAWPLVLQAVWLGGVLLGLVRLASDGLRLRRIILAATPATVGMERVLESADIAAPCVAGLPCPVILLPLGLAGRLSPDELRLVLAHERAHLKRGDLWLALGPALARALFWFFPPAWRAGAEWANAREEACDALALEATGAGRGDYGRLLLRLAGAKAAPPALGVSPGYHNLRQRLVSLSRPSGGGRFSSLWLLAAALPLLFPWRLTVAHARGLLGARSSFPDSAPLRYTVSDLGDAQAGDGEAFGLNDSGQAVGTARAGASAEGFLWDGGQSVALGTLPRHRFSLAFGLSAGGRVAGASYNIPGRGRAFVWDGGPHRLGSLPGFPYSEARAVNDAGEVAGVARTGGRDRWQASVARAFLWQGGAMTDLGTLGGPYSYAYGLNRAGAVVGKADTDTFGQTHAFVWQNGAMTDLGTLGGANSLAYRISDRGQIAGASETGDGDTRHAFLWSDGVLRDLGALPGTEDSAAYDVNGAGDAVGASALAPDSPIRRAFLWHGGRLWDLNALLPPGSGWTLDEARAINDRGQIAGSGTFGGQRRAFLLSPR